MTDTDPRPDFEAEDTVRSGDGGLSADERTWGMLCHLLVFTSFVVPFGNFVGPLVMWLIKKDESEFVDFHGKQVLNFQITLFLISIGGVLLAFLMAVLIPVIGFILVVLALSAVGIAGIVLTIIGAVKANQGESYRYPFSITLIR